jgi:hypothetical protein
MSSYRRNQLVIGLSILAIIGAAAWWYWSGTFEDQLVYRPANSKLNTEQFHVAQRWLQSQGQLTHNIHELGDLDLIIHHESQPILFLATPPGFFNDLEARRLHDWAERGGHIILPAPSVIRTRTRAPDINPHNLRACQSCLEPDNEADDEREWWRHAETRRLMVDPHGQSYEIWTRYGIEIPEETRGLETWTDSDGHPMVVRYSLGQGQITMLASWRWLDNQRLVYPQHVRLLEALAGDPGEFIYFQQRAGSGGLLSWLWQQAPVLWVMALVLLGLWAWSRWPRLGPLRDAGLGPDTRMEKHLLATARFDWQRHGAANLIGAMIEERQLRLRRRFPDWHNLDRSERTERLCALLPQLDEQAVDDLLDTQREHRSQSFIRLVRLHEQLMKVI